MSEVTSNPLTGVPPTEPPSIQRVTALIRPRLWPAVLILAVQWAAKLLAERFWQGEVAYFYAVFYGPLIGAGLVLLWWLFLSRVPWRDRLLALLAVLVGGAATVFTDPIAPEAGGFKLVLYALPIALTAGTLWLLVTRPLRWPRRRLGLLVALLLPFGYYALMRIDGVWGDMTPTLSWRWRISAIERSSPVSLQRQLKVAVMSPQTPSMRISA